ncbi:MAG: glycosyltransferase [Opitutaceae bacterium]|nr:glycosyltransferase [Opitutaceae bacterium]
MPRLLLLLPQLPQDPASGAARSMRTIAEFLAAAGWSVRALAVTASESATPIAAADFLRGTGATITVRSPNRTVYKHDRPVLEFTGARGIHYQLLDTGAHTAFSWHEAPSQFNRLYQRELADHKPDIVFGYGGHSDDVERWARARAAGCKIVFGLRNHGYKSAAWLRDFAGVLTCSEYLSGVYRNALGLASIGLPSPLDPDETIAPEREPIFFTAINPSIEKGLFFLARLAEELATRRPDIPMLFIESRGSGGLLVQAGLAGGFDLRRHESLMFAPAVPKPAEIFRGTRALLAPSVWDEPFGRVAAEALLNGVPPLVSNRGGLAEAANGGGFVLPLPASLTLETRLPVAAADVEPWLATIIRLADDQEFYAAASARARVAAAVYQPEVIGRRYRDYFDGILKS